MTSAAAAPRTREASVDTMRGLGILLVILGHVSTVPEPLFDVIYAFHMPAFLILSGWLWGALIAQRVTSVPGFARTRTRRLIVPAWLWGVLCMTAFLALEGWTGVRDFFSRVAGTATGYPEVTHNFLTSPQWFLFALLLVEVIAATALLHVRRIPDWAALVTIGLTGVAVSAWMPWVPFDAHIAISAALFFGLGVALGRNVFEGLVAAAQGRPATSVVAAGIVFAIAVWSSPAPVIMAQNFYGSNAWWVCVNLAAALAGSYLLWVAASRFPHSALAWLGARTIPILSANYLAERVVSAASPHWAVSFLADVALLVALVWTLDRVPVAGDLLNGRKRPVSVA